MIWRSRLRRRWRAWLVLALLLGIGAGSGLACLAGARRSASAFDRIARATDVPDVNTSHGLSADEADAISRTFTGVARYASVIGFTGIVENLDPTYFKFFLGPTSGDFARFPAGVALRSGRFPHADRPDEVLLTGRGVDLSGIGVGDRLTVRLFTTDLSEGVAYPVTVVGTAHDLDVAADRSQDRSSVRMTAAFTQANARRLQVWSATTLWAAPTTDVERDLVPQLRAVGWPIDETRAATQARVQDAQRPLGLTLALVGGFLLLATVLVVGQALIRQSHASRSETDALGAMGFTGGQVRLVELGMLLSVGLPGVMAAVAVAIALSPLFPVGALRPLEPDRGLHADVTVLALGAVGVLLVLAAAERLGSGRAPRAGDAVTLPRAAMAAWRWPVAATGLTLAFGATPTARRRFWATAWGATAALSLVIAAVAFVSALDRLSGEPARYGEAWELTARNAYGDVPPDQLRALLGDDRDIEGLAGAGVGTMLLENSLTVPGMAVLPIKGDIWPTLVDGSVPRSDDEVLVGSAVLEALDARIGDTVELRSQFYPGAPARMRIVGAAVFPSVDIAGVDPPRLDNGVALRWETYQGFQAGEDVFVDRFPDITFFDLADGVDPQTIIRRYADGLPELTGYAPTEWLPSLAPLEVIETQRASGLIWTFVGLLGATVAATLGHSLVAAVRQRRRDYAILKALGFTRRQVVGAVLWQSMAIVAVALVVSLPLGTGLGRLSWRAFADKIGVVDTPVIPVLGLLIVAAGTLLSAGLLATLPGAVAARTAAATALRRE